MWVMKSAFVRNLMQRARSLGIADNIYQVVLPNEETVEHRDGGKKEVVKRKIFPGYVFVQMDMGDNPDEPNEAWEVVRNTPGVTGFVGTATRAVPLSREEEARMLSTLGITGSKEKPRLRISFQRWGHGASDRRTLFGLYRRGVRSRFRQG